MFIKKSNYYLLERERDCYKQSCQQLRKFSESVINDCDRLSEKIEKAIEYIKEMQNSDLIFTHICEKELLEILGDKENEKE